MPATPGGVYDYYIEVKCGPKAKLSETQKAFKEAIEAAPEFGYDARYVICRFDEYGNLIEDETCKRLLQGYI